MSIHVVGPNDGEQSGGGPIRVRIIEDGSHTGHRLGLIEASVPAGPAMPPQHVHRDHDEIFIVTQGKLRFTSGEDSVDVEAGSCVTVPAGTAHTFSNPFDAPAMFLCTVTPTSTSSTSVTWAASPSMSRECSAPPMSAARWRTTPPTSSADRFGRSVPGVAQ